MHEDKTAVMQAVLRGSKAPTGAQLQRFQVFLEQRYGRPAQVTFQEEPALEEVLPQHFVSCHRVKEINQL